MECIFGDAFLAPFGAAVCGHAIYESGHALLADSDKAECVAGGTDYLCGSESLFEEESGAVLFEGVGRLGIAQAIMEDPELLILDEPFNGLDKRGDGMHGSGLSGDIGNTDESNAVVFKTQDMDSDIFNNLSTGQLNGVVISLLLSIKETFTNDKSLNTLLIDDPLQTIDDISAISLIDLLAEHFSNTQIVLSTHEDDKQYLLKKKYEQSGKRCQVLNMQEEYLRQ